MRFLFLSILALTASPLASLRATTLEKLSVDQMISKSNYIVRAKVISSSGLLYNRNIYTKFSLQIIESLKGSASPSMEVLVPGGTVNGMSQSIAGTPKLALGSEMVLFLWQSPKGQLLVIGMQQGAFDLQKDSTGQQFITRNAISDATVLDQATLVAQSDAGVTMALSELKRRIGASK